MGRERKWRVVGGVTALATALFLVETEAESARGPCPPNMSFIETDARSFCIDRYEGALVERSADGESPFSPYLTVPGHKVRAVSQPGLVPQAYISMNEAQEACHASKKRLCTEDEWVTACQGPTPTKYPYGDDYKESACNDHGDAPLPKVFPDKANEELFGRSCMNDPRLNQTRHTVAKTGAYSKCKNSFGVFDMVGNLHEWVDDPNGTFRGGYYLDTHINGDGCAYRTIAHDASYHDYSTGFRCCADVRGKQAKP